MNKNGAPNSNQITNLNSEQSIAAYAVSRSYALILNGKFNHHCVKQIESVQKNFLMYLLGTSSADEEQYRLPPYKDRCQIVGLQTLDDRRKIINLMFAFDILHNNMYDPNVSSNFAPSTRNRNLRSQNMLTVPLYRNDYSFNQPIAKLIRLINEFSVIFEDVIVRKIFISRVRNLICNTMNT